MVDAWPKPTYDDKMRVPTGVQISKLGNHKAVGFLGYTRLDPLKNHKATKQSMSGHHLSASEASLAVSTSVLEALPGKLDIKRHSLSILIIFGSHSKIHFID